MLSFSDVGFSDEFTCALKQHLLSAFQHLTLVVVYSCPV